jgi:hypothetical protein
VVTGTQFIILCISWNNKKCIGISVSFIQTSQLMLYRAVCSESHTEHINTVCGQNVEFVNVKLVVHIVTTGL